MIYQEIRLPSKNVQDCCDPTARTQETIVWFPADTCTTIQVAKIHARTIHALYKTQYSEILVKYEKSFDMTTGKIKVDPYATSHPINEGTTYVSVNFYKTKANLVENQHHSIVKVHVYKNHHS